MSDKVRVLIVEGRFYSDLQDELLAGARATLDSYEAEHETITVPGAFEIPAAIAMAARAGGYDGFVALGVVIRGETTHYDYVCGESARGLMNLTLEGHAIGYGVLTVEDEDQAWARARVNEGDKGGAAARACLDMIALKRVFKGHR